MSQTIESRILPPTYSTPAGSWDYKVVGVRQVYDDTLVGVDPNYKRTENQIRSFEAYEVGWDWEDGRPASENVVRLAVAMLYESFVVFRLAEFPWIAPSPSLLNDGSISLFWEVADFRAAIIIGPGEDDIRAIVRLDGKNSRFGVRRELWAPALKTICELIIEASR